MTRKERKYQAASDEQLSIWLNEGQTNTALGELYKRYSHLVFGLCLKYFKNQEDAEDMTMNIFSKLEKKTANKSIESFKSWLYTVAKNECLMKLRKKRYDHIEVNEELMPETEGQKKEKLNEELQYKQLEEAIEELTDEQAKTIKAFYLESKSYKEISEALSMPLKKVKSAIQNGKRNLRIKLEQNDLFKSA
jgi:RNA polymerase sigma-70 factor (ECF subfamily)